MSLFLNAFSLFLIACCVLTSDLSAQEVPLPENPSAWLNSPPITSQILEGKAALLYFYEES